MTLKRKTKVDNFDCELKEKSYTPKGWLSWSTKLAAEFLGTIFLVWMIGLLGVSFGGEKFEVLISGGMNGAASHMMIGLWVAFDVLVCLTVFARWSCDLNPAVSAYRMISKQNSLKYGMSKILVQMIAAIFAGLCIWSTQAISESISGLVNDDPTGAGNSWSAFTNTDITLASGTVEGGTAARHFLALGGEFLGTLILLWPIFTKSIKNGAVRDIILVIAVGIGVATLLEMGTVGWNPARSLGTNWIYDAVKGDTKAMELYWAYAVGPIMSAFALYFIQNGVHKYVAPAWEKWLTIGQVQDK